MTSISSTMLAGWREKIGRSETRRELLASANLERFALAIGLDRDRAGGQPALAHWAFFLPRPGDAELGLDGHPRRGRFLPDIPLPSRMFAGSQIEFSAPLRIGEKAEQIVRIVDITHKTGRSGELVFVDVEKTVTQAATHCVTERQKFVYRSAGAPIPPPSPTPGQPRGEIWQPQEVHLFRFSAATFNSHRIHYDRPYATQVEGYPDLVVHGPFTAAKLAELARRDGCLKRFSFTARAPLFAGQPIGLERTSEGGWAAIRCDGVEAMTATAEFA